MNLFASLVDRALGRAPVLQRRRPTAFEPVKHAMVTTRDDAIDSLREEQSYVDVDTSSRRETSNVGESRSELSVDSQPKPSVASSRVTPKATDLTIVEEQPAFKTTAPQASDHNVPDLPVQEQNLTQEPQQLSKPSTALVAPALETIVETKPETQVVIQKLGDEKPFDEVDLVADAPDDVQASIVNNIVVLRSIAQKQNSDQFDESHLVKPVQHRRPTRQQMQRSAREHSQPAHETLDTPAPPTINVTIGRVEVRASAPAKRAAESTRQTGPKLSLDEYLRGRSKGN